jgi:hypothetical protein
MQVHAVNSNSRNSNCQCSLLSKKNPIIRIFCISGLLAVPINPDKWSSTVYCIVTVNMYGDSACIMHKKLNTSCLWPVSCSRPCCGWNEMPQLIIVLNNLRPVLRSVHVYACKKWRNTEKMIIKFIIGTVCYYIIFTYFQSAIYQMMY